jgi:RNA polymerase sigma factor (sigma-70 family)
MNVSAHKRSQLTTAVDRSSGDLLRYLQRRVRSDDAADLLGETMVIAWRRVAELPDDPEGVRMWLFGLARGTLLNYARGERRRWALAEKLRAHADTLGTARPADDGNDVRDAIAQLGPELAEIVQLVHWEGFSLTQAAEVIGIPAPTARGRYARAKEQLRIALGVVVG